uniref:Uncharacterized protein n=1 Tax=Oryza brachyantha TaxID=4533 RepID=J3N7D9_ORYBR
MVLVRNREFSRVLFRKVPCSTVYPPRRGRLSKPGFSRQSVIKMSFQQEQAVFSTPTPPSPSGSPPPTALTHCLPRHMRDSLTLLLLLLLLQGMHGLAGRMATRSSSSSRSWCSTTRRSSSPRATRGSRGWSTSGLARAWSVSGEA